MKKLLILSLITIICISANAQNKEIALKSFHKVIVSPHISVKFIESNEEKVVIDKLTVDRSKFNAEVKGKTLRIYLDDAKVVTKTIKEKGEGYKVTKPIYPNTSAKVTVYYKKIKELSLRGEESFLVESKLNQEAFRLKVYGESEVYLNNVQLKKLNVTIYGESVLKILEGSIQNQKFKAYGESVIDASDIVCSNTKIVSFGEGSYRVHALENLKVTSFGESVVYNSGNADLNKGIVIGENVIVK